MSTFLIAFVFIALPILAAVTLLAMVLRAPKAPSPPPLGPYRTSAADAPPRERIAGVALSFACAICLMVAPLVLPGCPNAQTAVQNETLALDLTQSACSVADTTGNAVVILACTIAQLGEQTAIQVTNLFVSVPAASCAAFASAHPESAASVALAASYKAAHPGVEVDLGKIWPGGAKRSSIDVWPKALPHASPTPGDVLVEAPDGKPALVWTHPIYVGPAGAPPQVIVQ